MPQMAQTTLGGLVCIGVGAGLRQGGLSLAGSRPACAGCCTAIQTYGLGFEIDMQQSGPLPACQNAYVVECSRDPNT